MKTAKISTNYFQLVAEARRNLGAWYPNINQSQTIGFFISSKFLDQV